jgi:protein SCO1/2
MNGAPDTRWRRAGALGVGMVALLAAATYYSANGLPRHWGARAATVFHARDVSAEGWGGGFTLSDAAGRPRSLADFRGKVVLLTFGYTHCPDACPTTLAKLAEVRRLLGPEARHVQGIFVTVDPERDTAPLLGRYVPSFDPSLIGLRGTEAQTDAAAQAYHAQYQITEYQGNIMVDHTTSTYVIDPEGKTRLVSPYDQTARALADDVLALLREG